MQKPLAQGSKVPQIASNRAVLGSCRCSWSFTFLGDFHFPQIWAQPRDLFPWTLQLPGCHEWDLWWTNPTGILVGTELPGQELIPETVQGGFLWRQNILEQEDLAGKELVAMPLPWVTRRWRGRR